ncbi:MAG: DUF1684 domain-containing protein [Saprospirales bacterium]|nr:DUF1684 domain-containing protein [Saprospirales bacterium]MBK8921840.1 DUF1684 domain-containing protein [Saprospirales bacterium]
MLLRFCFLLCLFMAGSLRAQQADSVYLAEIVRHREHYKQEFLTEERSPLTARDTALLDFFPPEPAWHFPARVERTPDAQPFEMPTYSGRTKPFVRYGIVHFQVAGKPCRLALYQNLNLAQQEAYKDYLFLPFKDHSNGDATYGGGRYLDFRLGDIAANGTLLLDFNKAYNPWCAYSDGYNCPIPPAENHLQFAVEAGEKQYKGEKKH